VGAQQAGLLGLVLQFVTARSVALAERRRAPTAGLESGRPLRAPMHVATQRRRWFLLTGSALAVAGFLIVSSWQRERRTREAWQRVHELAATIAAPFAPAVKAHAPLLGEAQPGEAGAHYRLATRLAREAAHRDKQEPALLDVLELPHLPTDLGERLEPLREALDALTAGAACDRIDKRLFVDELENPTWDEVAGLPVPAMAGTYHIYKIALTAMRAELEAGSTDAAMGRTVVLLTLARDQMLLDMATHELLATAGIHFVSSTWSDERLRALPPGALRTFAAALQRWDEAVSPASCSAASECAIVVRRAPASRSPRAAACERYVDAVRALPPETATWAVRERALAAAAALLPDIGAPLDAVERSRRATCAEVRLLRMAIAHHLDEPLPALPDPLDDGPLLVTERDGERVFASRALLDGKPIERTVRTR
jgi:hypothetical protein